MTLSQCALWRSRPQPPRGEAAIAAPLRSNSGLRDSREVRNKRVCLRLFFSQTQRTQPVRLPHDRCFAPQLRPSLNSYLFPYSPLSPSLSRGKTASFSSFASLPPRVTRRAVFRDFLLSPTQGNRDLTTPLCCFSPSSPLWHSCPLSSASVARSLSSPLAASSGSSSPFANVEAEQLKKPTDDGTSISSSSSPLCATRQVFRFLRLDFFAPRTYARGPDLKCVASSVSSFSSAATALRVPTGPSPSSNNRLAPFSSSPLSSFSFTRPSASFQIWYCRKERQLNVFSCLHSVSSRSIFSFLRQEPPSPPPSPSSPSPSSPSPSSPSPSSPSPCPSSSLSSSSSPGDRASKRQDSPVVAAAARARDAEEAPASVEFLRVSGLLQGDKLQEKLRRRRQRRREHLTSALAPFAFVPDALHSVSSRLLEEARRPETRRQEGSKQERERGETRGETRSESIWRKETRREETERRGCAGKRDAHRSSEQTFRRSEVEGASEVRRERRDTMGRRQRRTRGKAPSHQQLHYPLLLSFAALYEDLALLKNRILSQSRRVRMALVLSACGFCWVAYNWEDVRRRLGLEGAAVLHEGMQSQELQFTAREFSKQLIDDLLQDHRLQAGAQRWVQELLSASDREVAALAVRALNGEEVQGAVKRLLDDLVRYLCQNAAVQQQVAELLSYAITLPVAKDTAAWWFQELLQRPDVQQAAQTFVNNAILSDPSVRAQTGELAQWCSTRVVNDQATADATRDLLLHVLADSTLRKFVSDFLWQVLKGFMQPRWLGGGSKASELHAEASTSSSGLPEKEGRSSSAASPREENPEPRVTEEREETKKRETHRENKDPKKERLEAREELRQRLETALSSSDEDTKETVTVDRESLSHLLALLEKEDEQLSPRQFSTNALASDSPSSSASTSSTPLSASSQSSSPSSSSFPTSSPSPSSSSPSPAAPSSSSSEKQSGAAEEPPSHLAAESRSPSSLLGQCDSRAPKLANAEEKEAWEPETAFGETTTSFLPLLPVAADEATQVHLPGNEPAEETSPEGGDASDSRREAETNAQGKDSERFSLADLAGQIRRYRRQEQDLEKDMEKEAEECVEHKADGVHTGSTTGVDEAKESTNASTQLHSLAAPLPREEVEATKRLTAALSRLLPVDARSASLWREGREAEKQPQPGRKESRGGPQ
ncbi:hypothetical protein TGVAND_207040 [Toxoplasma gondii VAND]|uniref:Uncharacterized protein n=1 Tax=Toxoplasma gondii VAND TaxID=933077 RepID=A0A086PGA8_TOXGO|nr:hypothetical protein TGVAND_207040 [Toxoplasma gondii VAND]